MRITQIGNRWKIILIVTLFNLLYEYSLRGIKDFSLHPWLPLYLFLTYFSYFAMIEDLITRFRLKDYQVFVAALFFGLLWQLVGPSIVFFPPFILGINWLGLLFVNFFWWCSIQTVMGFYIANRVTPRDWNHPLLSKTGWGMVFSLFVLITFFARICVPNFPPSTPQQIITMIGLILATAIFFKKILPLAKERSSLVSVFKKDKVMDCLSIFVVVYFFLSTIFLTTNPTLVGAIHLNRTALRAGIAVAVIIVTSMFIHRLVSKKSISV